MDMTITYSRKGEIHCIETGGQALPKIIIDNTGLLPEQRGGTAKQLLGCSAVFCYMSTLIGALDAREARISDVSAKVSLEIGSNSRGQGRVKKICIDASVSMPEDDASIFTRVEKIMKNGCLITSSLHDGIEMEYHLQAHFTKN